nr:MAG TPA: hypothetical protein [Caudoviricetes sp.]
MNIDLPLNLDTVNGDTSTTRICCDGDTLKCNITSHNNTIIKISTLINGELISKGTKTTFDIPVNIDFAKDKKISGLYSHTFYIFTIKQNTDKKIIKQKFEYIVYIYKSTLLNTVGRYNIIDAQLIDNDENHIFFITETEHNNIIFNKLKQVANRKMVYLRKKAETIPVISTEMPQIDKAHFSNQYNVVDPANTNVIFTPISSNISNTLPLEKEATYNSPDTHTVNMLDDIINHK